MFEATFTQTVKAPFRLDLTVWVLRRRQKNTIDLWDGQRYTRILTLYNLPVRLTVTLWPISPSRETKQLLISLQCYKQLSVDQHAEVVAITQKMLGLAVDVQPFYELVSRNQTLDQLTEQYVGVRPPRFPTVFEALINAVACQQVSLDVGILLLNRLSEKYGMEFADNTGIMHAFPRPEDLLDEPEGDLKHLGFSYQKARTIKEIAYIAANDGLQLEGLEAVNNVDILAQLQAVRGIGRWSAEYVLLRGLGRLEVFPGDDIGGQNNVQKLLGLTARPTYDELKKLTDAWRPYAGFVYFYLLLTKLHEKGLV